MLKFKCDRCGKEMQRSEAWAIVLAPGAYAVEGEKKRTQGEICGDCAEIILKEMIYMEASAQERQGCRALQGSDGGACEVGVPAADVLREQWISVKDKLPETEEEVLVLTVSKTGNVNVDKGYLLNGRFVHRGSAVVTHWMPLPAPPEEDKP